MRNFTRLLTSVFLFVGFSATALAAGFVDADKSHTRNTTVKVDAAKSVKIGQSRSQLSELSAEKLKAGKVQRFKFADAAQSGIKSITLKDFDVNGEKMQLNYDGNDEFYSVGKVTLKKIGEDSLAIYSLGMTPADTPVKAKVDWTSGTFTIDVQPMYMHEKYGECDIVPVNPVEKTYNLQEKITGKIDASSITLSPWACLIMAGDYKDYVLGTFYSKTVIMDSNAKMTGKELNADSAVVDYEIPVIVEQEATNLLKIYNFAGVNCCVKVEIRGNKTLSIAPQLLTRTSNYGTFFCYPADWTIGYYYPRFRIKGSVEGDKLAWGNWIVQSSDGKYTMRRVLNTEIELPFTLKLPAAATQVGFKGTGTEADPYLIENIADLFALSDSVNSTIATGGLKYGKAFDGKYFKQTANINLNGYKFCPIGGTDDYFRFAGTYDGNNKTISNLNVATGGDGYCALFGAVDTVGVLKNIKLSSPKSNAQYYYTGTVAAFCPGKIENCHVTGAQVKGYFCVGGVAAISGETTDCSFENGTVTGESQVGGVLGVTRSPVSKLYSTGSTISCYSSQESASVGGVVGYVSNQRKGRISDCYFSGNVLLEKSGEYGGLIAGIAVESTIERSFATGTLSCLTSTSKTAAGGIVGAVQGATISDCYFAGDVAVPSINTGHIIGYAINVAMTGYTDHSTIKNCYTSGYAHMTTRTYDYNPYLGRFDTTTGGKQPVVENCKFDSQLLPLFGTKAGATATADMTSGTVWDGYDAEAWVFTAGKYPRLKGIEATATAYVSAAPAIFSSADQTTEGVTSDFTVSTDNSVTWKVANDGILGTSGKGVNIEKANVYLNGSFATDTVYATSGKVQKWFIIKLSPNSMFEGAGTEENPYKLKTKQDLINLSVGTTDNRLTFDGSHFLVTNDIDLEYDEAFKGISSTSSDTYSFGGVIDGGNHYIHRWRMVCATIDADRKIVKKDAYRGFVSRLKANGVVKNLRIASDCDLTFYSHSGAIVGNNNGTIDNCRNYADIVAYSGTTGGIAGYGKKGGVIRNCYNGGNVTAGYMAAAGIVPFNYGFLENCQNDGEITIKDLSANYKPTAYNSASGICHSNLGDGEIHNVLNTGYVHTYKYVGGICGVYNGTAGKVMVDGAVNLGMLDIDATAAADKLTVGNIIGKMYKVGVCKAVFYDGQVSTFEAGNGNSVDGVEALTTAQLTSGKALEGLDPEYWYFEKGKYPVLKLFKDEEGSKAAAASVVDFCTSERSDKVKTDATLGSAEGLAWSVVTGSAFKVDGSVLSMDPADELADTLVAACGKFVKRIPIVATPDKVVAPVITTTTAGGKTMLKITSETDGASIYFTTDGSEPTASSALYQDGAVEITSDVTVKAIAVKHNYYASDITTTQITHSGVGEVAAEKLVLCRKYISTSGIESATPFDGLNIVVTTYDDGTQSVAKKALQAK